MNREHPADLLMLTIVIVWALFTLAGCGGGDPDMSRDGFTQPAKESTR